MHTWTSRCVPRLLARWSSRTPYDRPLGGGRPRLARTRKQRGCLGGKEACGRIMTGGRAAALLLVGVLIGGISGGAAATYLTYRAAQSPGQSAPVSVGLPVATTPPASSGTADEEIVNVVKDLLPSVVTVINYAAN